LKVRKDSEEQIICVINEAEAETEVADLYSKYWMNDASYYRRKVKYVDLNVNELKKAKSVEDGNRHLK
jgi:hypothetical protein